MMTPWFVPEITPPVLDPAVHRLGLDPADAARNVRAIVEAQAMAMRIHSRWFAPRATAIRATGGAAANPDILQVIADVFDAEVVRGAPPNAASLGAALRAFHADRLAERNELSWTDIVAGFTAPDAGLRIRPNPASVAVYTAQLPAYEKFELRARGITD
jgi:xylulokinase